MLTSLYRNFLGTCKRGVKGHFYQNYFLSYSRSMAAEVNVVLATLPENSLDEKPAAFAGDNDGKFASGKSKLLDGQENPVLDPIEDHVRPIEPSESEDEEDGDDDDEEDAEHMDDFVSNLDELRERRSRTPVIPPTVSVLTHRCDLGHEHGPPDGGGDGGDVVMGRIYLVGTAHFSHESQSDVRMTIRETQPDIVMVELCPSRVAILALNEESLLEEARSLTTEKMLKIVREAGVVQGVMHILLLSMSAHITRQLGMAPGGEFRVAFEEAQKIPGCRWHLGDRLIQTTMARALGTLSLWQKLRLFWSILWSHNIQITKEEVEKCKQRDLLEELLREMAGEFPELSRIFVEERDEYMAHTLYSLLHHAAAKRREQLSENDPWEPVVIVGVVGMGHVPGIVANFGKRIDIRHLLETPKPSRWTHCAKFAFKGAFVGVTAYVAYKSLIYAYSLFVR